MEPQEKKENIFTRIGMSVLAWPLKTDWFGLEGGIVVTILCAPYTAPIWLPPMAVGYWLDQRQARKED